MTVTKFKYFESDMEEKLLEIMKTVFAPEDVTPHTTQQNCSKWDSLNHLNLMVALEDAFDVEFEPEQMAEMKSVEVILAMLRSLMQ